VPAGTEDALFGNGVILQVTISWGTSGAKLYLNNNLVKSVAYTVPTPNWSAASNFDLGAYEYLTYGGYDVSDDAINQFSVSGPATTGQPPLSVSMTSPANNAAVSGATTLTASASGPQTLSSVQFTLDGGPLATVPGTGPSYNYSWDTTTALNGTHSLAAIVTDALGNTATSSGVTVTVGNSPAPVISGIAAGAISSSSATITWSTSTASTSQVNYGINSSYGSNSALDSSLVTAHSVALTGLSASTTYHYQVLSQDGSANLSTSADFTFTTSAVASGPQPALLLHLDASEVSGVTKGSTITPSVGPAGFTGAVVANGTGSVNFTPAQTGNGVYFLNCCANSNNAYYKFTGAGVGSIFNSNQGEITFYLKSRYSFAQRSANASGARYAFDVRDGNGSHLFYFLTQIVSGRLVFTYYANGSGAYYYVPVGTEDSLFGNGVVLQVNITWTSTGVNLYLNNTLVKSASYTTPTPNWSVASNFDVGGYEYLTFGGYNTSDDIIDEFTVWQSTGH
jgi:Bacterial Ig domain/Purple acid Phosphatase, N-terminal domain